MHFRRARMVAVKESVLTQEEITTQDVVLVGVVVLTKNRRLVITDNMGKIGQTAAHLMPRKKLTRGIEEIDLVQVETSVQRLGRVITMLVGVDNQRHVMTDNMGKIGRTAAHLMPREKLTRGIEAVDLVQVETSIERFDRVINTATVIIRVFMSTVRPKCLPLNVVRMS